MEVTLFDTSGDPTAYFDEDGTIYLWNGKSMAYLDGEAVYGWKGRHIGWFVDGIIYGLDGAQIAYVAERVQGLRRIESIKTVKRVDYVKYAQHAERARPPLRSVKSDQDFTEFLAQDSVWQP